MSEFKKGKMYILERNNKNQVVHIDATYQNNSKDTLFLLILCLKTNQEIKNIISDIFLYLKKYIYKPTLYEYHYGIWGFHEGFCYSKNLRVLNKFENKLKKENRYFELPNDLI
jgi:hypothetical protein